MRKLGIDPSALRRGLVSNTLSALLFVAGVAYLPYLWCSRHADAWLSGDAELHRSLGAGVARWVRDDLSRADFDTGHSLFNGEWLFGTYMMAAMGYGQSALAHPELRAEHTELMARCIDRVLSAEVRAFDHEAWGEDPLAALDGGGHHAAYTGYMNLTLGLHRRLDPDSRFAALNDRVSAKLARDLAASPLLLLQSYPNEVYPVDNCAVVGSVALHADVTGQPRPQLVTDWLARCRRDYIDPRSGLLFQAIDSLNGEPVDHARGSGTALGLYFVSFADPALSAELYAATRRSLGRVICGFGGVREYPAWIEGGPGDIDSGPVVLGFSLSATGFLIAGARLHGDTTYFSRLYATAHAWGAPIRRGPRLNFVTGGSLGDAILFAMLTASHGDGHAQ